MGDSDEEHDRRAGGGRDKFRHERNDYERREERRPPPHPPQTWEERASLANRRGGGMVGGERREGYRDFDRRPRYSPQREGGGGSPPHIKRMRGEWEEGYPPRFDLPPYMGGPMHGHPPPHNPHMPPHPPGAWGGPPPGELPAPPHFAAQPSGGQKPSSDGESQPQMMSFKLFLQAQPDDISDTDAVEKYAEYKMDFRRHQISDFFLQHKEQEWFRLRYHPDESTKCKEASLKAVQNRCDVFNKLLQLNLVQPVSLNIDCSEDVLRLLNAAVILMEGGTEYDLKSVGIELSTAVPPTTTKEVKVKKENSTAAPEQINSTDENGEQSEDKSKSEEKSDADAEAGSAAEAESAGDEQKKEQEKEEGEEEDGEIKSSDKTSEDKQGEMMKTDGIHDDEGPEEGEDIEEPKPRNLHKTLSVFFRNLAPVITKHDIEEVCNRFPGFLRVALQDPQPDRKLNRCGWATYRGDINIKDVCWNLQTIKIKDCELGAIVNAELKQRLRTVSGITGHVRVARRDLKHSIRIIQSLDRQWNLWKDLCEKKDEEKDVGDAESRNPLLSNISDLLVEETKEEPTQSAPAPVKQEQTNETVQKSEADTTQDKDDDESAEVDADKTDESPAEDVKMEMNLDLLKVNLPYLQTLIKLDELVLYLRIVHSIDFYNATEYQQEDIMPHRCGIFHLRGPPPTTKVTDTEVDDWIKSFENKLTPLMDCKKSLDDSEMLKFGRKETEQEVEKFIKANTQEISKEKWLCPLSGKKFKGPDFVRKHILSKHSDKVEEVKQEVLYFNNYLRDPKRPELPEHPAGKQLPTSRDTHVPPGYPGALPPPPLPHMGYRHPGPPPGAGHPAYPRGGGHSW